MSVAKLLKTIDDCIEFVSKQLDTNTFQPATDLKQVHPIQPDVDPKDDNKAEIDDNKNNDDDNKDSLGFDNDLMSLLINLNKNENNFIFSSFSILAAMTMCMLGANNNTLKQMLNILYSNSKHTSNPQKLINNIINLSKYYNETYDGTRNKPILNCAHKLWLKNGYKLLDKYTQATGYDIIDSFDPTDVRKAANDINNWCAENTIVFNNMDKEIISPNILKTAILIITNVIYFKGKFVQPFNKSKTRENTPFYTDWTHKIQKSRVTMMFVEEKQIYAVYKKKWNVVKLPYINSKISLILVQNQFFGKDDDIFTTTDLLSIDKWNNEKITLYVPKFKYEYEIILNDVFKKMGIKDAFDNDLADFSNMSNRKLVIDQIIHKAVIEIDEVGTEAAAVTAVVMKGVMLLPSIRYDYPFTFYIFDEEKQVALFSGAFNGK